MKVTNLWNESRELKHNRLFEVSSNFKHSEIINSPTEKQAVELFKSDHPKIKNYVEVKELNEFQKGCDIKLIKEV